MREELDKKLVEDFPLLYADRGRSMQETCMCWGFSCGDGWEPLIRELSSKLEPLIKKIADKNNKRQCYTCGCSYESHSQYPGNNACITIHKLPYHINRSYRGSLIPQWKRDLKAAWTGKNYWYGGKTQFSRLLITIKRLFKEDWEHTKFRIFNRISRSINKFLYFLHEKFDINYPKLCHCKGYEINHPRASQVKEKFGTLSFYMTSATDEMWDIISEAEQKSGTICEDCGASGRRRGGGWIRTLCDTCAKKSNQELGYQEWIEEMEKANKKLVPITSLSCRPKENS